MHILHQYDFDTIYLELSSRVLDGLVNEQANGDLSLFNYTNKCSYEKQWDDFTLSARGLILDRKRKCIAALPFEKFFNLGELSFILPDLPFTTTTKEDGSLIIIFYYNGKWNTATRGSFNSEQAKWAATFLTNYVDTSTWNKNYTYLCEAIYPENKIVIDYKGKEALVLLGIYDSTTFEEIDIQQNSYVSNKFYPTNTHYYDNLDAILETAKTLSHNNEGFVVRFANGYRIKIKGDEYVRIHRLISQVTPLGVWRCFVENPNFNSEEFRKQLPEEVLRDYDNICEILHKKSTSIYANTYNEYLKLQMQIDGISNDRERRKVFAILAKNSDNFSYLMSMYCNESEAKLKERIFKSIKPVGNILEGYTPSSSMNRFEQAHEESI